jgi:hypothetical protein
LMEFGIEPVYNLLYGFLGEIPDDYQVMAQVIELIKHLPPPRAVRQVRLERFSPYFEHADDFGIQNVRPARIFQAIYPLPDDVLFNLVHHFEFDFADSHPGTYTKDWRNQVADWIRHAGESWFIAAHWKDSNVCIDSRFSQCQEPTTICGLTADVFELCDTVHSPENLAKELNVSVFEVQTILAELVQRKQILNIGKRYLSLAVRVDQYMPNQHLEFSNLVEFMKETALKLSKPLIKLRDDLIEKEKYKEIWAN